MNVITKMQRPTTSVSFEEARHIGFELSRVHGVRVDLGRLAHDDRLELVGLARKATTEGAGTNLMQLSKGERRRYEALVERASDLDVGHFEAERKQQEQLRRFSELARRAARAALPTSREKEATLFETIFSHLAGKPTGGAPALYVDQAGVLVAIVAQLVAGEALSVDSTVTVEDGEPVLRYNASVGFLGRAAEDGFAINTRLLSHLEANGWIVVDQRGPQSAIRLGARTRNVLNGGSNGGSNGGAK